MIKTALLLTTVSALAFATPAFAADKEVYSTETKIEKDAKGNFNEKTKTTKKEMDGTTNSFEKKIDISVDAHGNTDKTTTTETVTDPKGLGNKQIVKTKDTEKTKDGKTTATHEASVNGKDVKSDSSFERASDGSYERKDTISRTDAAGTTRSAENKVSIEVDSSGNSKKTASSETTTDPEGLGNKTSVKTTDTEKVTSNEVTTTHEKKVNGDVVDKVVHTTPAR